jgi:hypothetical protein
MEDDYERLLDEDLESVSPSPLRKLYPDLFEENQENKINFIRISDKPVPNQMQNV